MKECEFSEYCREYGCFLISSIAEQSEKGSRTENGESGGRFWPFWGFVNFLQRMIELAIDDYKCPNKDKIIETAKKELQNKINNGELT